MTHVAMVVTNSCSPDPRVERHALWLTKMGHNVEIHAWDRDCSNKENETKTVTKLSGTESVNDESKFIAVIEKLLD